MKVDITKIIIIIVVIIIIGSVGIYFGSKLINKISEIEQRMLGLMVCPTQRPIIIQICPEDIGRTEGSITNKSREIDELRQEIADLDELLKQFE